MTKEVPAIDPSTDRETLDKIAEVIHNLKIRNRDLYGFLLTIIPTGQNDGEVLVLNYVEDASERHGPNFESYPSPKAVAVHPDLGSVWIYGELAKRFDIGVPQPLSVIHGDERIFEERFEDLVASASNTEMVVRTDPAIWNYYYTKAMERSEEIISQAKIDIRHRAIAADSMLKSLAGMPLELICSPDN